MKYILCLSLLTLTSCGNIDRTVAKMAGYSTNCVNGVEYIQFPSGVTVSYNQDGSVRLCK